MDKHPVQMGRKIVAGGRTLPLCVLCGKDVRYVPSAPGSRERGTWEHRATSIALYTK